MRFLASILLAVALAACATAAPPASTAPPPVSARPSASEPWRILNSAGRPDAPTLEAVTRVLGQPTLSRQDGAGTAVTYRLEHCALLLLFTADARNVMRLAEASPGPRRTGETAPSLDQCGAEAHAHAH